ncbi:MAG TPA: DUF1570 domain-containing protein [Planctomycetota bacterium]
MALVVIRCPCGCVFRRDETSEKVCPSCGAFHEGGETLAEKLSPASLRNLLVLAGSILAGLLIVLLAILYRKLQPPPEPVSTAPASPRLAPRPLKADVAPPKAAPPTPAAPPAKEVALLIPEEDDLDPPEVARAYRLVARANLGALAKTVLLLSDAKEAAARLQASLQAEHEELADLLRRHRFKSELSALPHRIEPRDVITAFATAALDPDRPGPFIHEVKTWFRTLQPGAVALVSVRRAGAPLLLAIYAPTFEEDIASVIRLTGTVAGAGGIGDAQVTRPLAAALLDETLRRFEALHPVYRDALPAEIAPRLDLLLRRASGSEDDEDFLRHRVLNFTFRPIEEEYAGLLRKSAELEVQAYAAVLPDVLHFKDGRRLTVRILEEPAGQMRVRVANGEARLSTADLSKVERGQPVVKEVEARYAKHRDDIAGLLAILPLVRDARMKPLRDLVCARVLTLDPLHETAWSELGFPRRAAPSATRERDAVRMKDGTKRIGVIVEENAEGVTLETPILGGRGETLGTGRARLERADIERIDRMSEEGRELARARTAELNDARRRFETELARIALAPAAFHGFKGVSARGTHFELLSAAPERETREAAHALETIFAAFQKEFGARRNAGRRVLVHFLPDRAGYDAFQQAVRGEILSHPAYFSLKENHIVAFDAARSPETLAAREAIQRAKDDVERHRRGLAEEEASVESRLKVLRQSFADEVAARRRAADALAGAERDRALKEIDGLGERNNARLRQSEQRFRDQLAKVRREARRTIETHQTAEIRAGAVLAVRAAELRATLIHEAFHAFAANFLWAELDNARLPRWLHEGFASYFETGVLEAGEFSHGSPHPRHLALLRERARAGALLPAEATLRAGPETFAGDHLSPAVADVPYAHAWLIAHWIASRGLDRDALDRYAQAAARGADPAEALETLTGLSRPDLDAAVRLHLDRLAEKPR